MNDVITAGRGGIYIDLHVQPRARRPGVLGVHGERLKIAVSEAAEEGKANLAAVEAIAHFLGVPNSAVSLVAGRASRQKRVFVQGVDVARALRVVEAST